MGRKDVDRKGVGFSFTKMMEVPEINFETAKKKKNGFWEINAIRGKMW